MMLLRHYQLVIYILALFQMDAMGVGSAQAADLVSGLVLNVVDGDTLKDVDSGDRIRLLGVDACETDQLASTSIGQTIDCGIAPSAALIEWTANIPVTCEFDGKDVYGRWLATCGNETIPDFSAELIRRGLAVAYRYKGKAQSSDYERIEQQAKATRQGLWQYNFDNPWTYRKKTN